MAATLSNNAFFMVLVYKVNTLEILKPKRIPPSFHLVDVYGIYCASLMANELVTNIWNTCPPVSISMPMLALL